MNIALTKFQARFKKFPTEGPQVLQGPGEGAGIVDIGDGLAVVLKQRAIIILLQ